jgi:hypothetical protein
MTDREVAPGNALAIQARAHSVLHREDGTPRPRHQRLDVIEYSENAEPEIYGGGALRKAVKRMHEDQRRKSG